MALAFFRIRKEIKEYPTMVFQYREQGSGFVTELVYKEQKINTDVVDDTVNDTVNGTVNGTVNEDRLEKILKEITSNNRISISELSKKNSYKQENYYS